MPMVTAFGAKPALGSGHLRVLVVANLRSLRPIVEQDCVVASLKTSRHKKNRLYGKICLVGKEYYQLT
jgi:hypothetical protein